MTAAPTPAERYQELVDRVDAFFARVLAQHRAEMRCGAGCDGCCHVQPTLTPLEAAAVVRWLGEAGEAAREDLRRRALADRPNRCVALGDDGRCLIYAARPLICRSHGLPIRLRDRENRPFVATCVENFRDGSPAEETILDQQTLSTNLSALNRAFAADGDEEPVRVALRDLILTGAPIER